MISAIFDVQVTPILPFKFQANKPFYSEDKDQNFQDGNCGGHKLLAIFDLQVTSMILTSFKSNGLLVQEKEGKLDFQDSRHLGFLIVTI